MSVVDYTSTRNKKRARVKGTYIDNRPEIKTWNAAFNEDHYPTSLLMVNPCMRVSQNNKSTGWGSWCPLPLMMPTQGDGAHSHIGKKINIKWLRFKGYVRSYQRLFAPTRWRLVLYRTDFPMTAAIGQQQYVNPLGPLWINFEDPHKEANNGDIHKACAHNFYKLIKDVDFWRLHNVSRTVICSGILQPPPWRDPQGYSKETGSQTAVAKMQHSTFWWNEWYTNDYINAKLDLNDTYTYPETVTIGTTTRQYAPSCYYAIQLETDQALGITGVSDTNFFLTTCDNFTLVKDDKLFELNFFIRGYFTDA